MGINLRRAAAIPVLRRLSVASRRSRDAGRLRALPCRHDDAVWAILAHLSYFVLGLVAPLAIYLVKKDSPFARRQAAEAFNFHVTLTLAAIVSAVLMLVLIGFVLVFVVLLWGAVLSVVAAVASGKGRDYRYPLTLRLLS